MSLLVCWLVPPCPCASRDPRMPCTHYDETTTHLHYEVRSGVPEHQAKAVTRACAHFWQFEAQQRIYAPHPPPTIGDLLVRVGASFRHPSWGRRTTQELQCVSTSAALSVGQCISDILYSKLYSQPQPPLPIVWA